MLESADTPDFFRTRPAEMIDLRHPLAVLASRLPWTQIEANLSPFSPAESAPAESSCVFRGT